MEDARSIHPCAMTLDCVVHAVHEVRNPAGIGLGASDDELGMALEHATHDHHRYDVLITANDRHERGRLRSPVWVC